MDSCAQFLVVAEHWLIPSRVWSVGHFLRKAGHQSVWSPACQDKVAGGHAGFGVVSLGAAPLALPTFATAGFLEFFKLERALRVTLPAGNGRVVNLLSFMGIRGRRRTLSRCSSLIRFCKLLLLRLRWCVLVSLSGDLIADPEGRFVDLALAYSLGEGKRPAATCKFKLDECSGTRRDFILGCPDAVTASIACMVTDRWFGFPLIFLCLLPLVLMVGLRRFPALSFPNLCGPPAGLTLLIALLHLHLVLFRMPGMCIGMNLVLYLLTL